MKKPKKATTLRRHEKVRKAYIKLLSAKENGVRKYSDELILRKLHLKFDLSESYIDEIISYRV